MPDAVSLGPLIVPVVRTGTLVALVLGSWVAFRVALRMRLPASYVGTTAEWALYAYLIGARFGFVLTNWGSFAEAPWAALYLWQPGYLPLAGLAGAAAVVVGRVLKVAPALRRYHLVALGSGALVAALLYGSVLGLVRLDLRPQLVTAGEVVPDFAMRDLQGQEVRFSDLQGRPVVLNFWATWCPPCRREMPALDATYLAHREHDLAIVGVDVGEPAFVVERFLEENPVRYPIWVDPPREEGRPDAQALLRSFGGIGLPTTVFIDRSGIVRSVRVGELNRAVLENEVRTLLR